MSSQSAHENKLVILPKTKKKTNRRGKLRREFESWMRWNCFIVGFAAPAAMTSQILLVWGGQISGIAPLSWVLLTLKSSLYAAWGFERRLWVVVLKESCSAIANAAVLLGYLYYVLR